MQKTIRVRLLPREAGNSQIILEHIAAVCGIHSKAITGFYPVARSVDARSKNVFINLTLQVSIDEPFQARNSNKISFPGVHDAKYRVLVIGAGPAGLFAALKLIELGIQPILLERGKDVRARRRDLALLNKEGLLNPESNYCFGEGGAGTYSDGKLYTRSKKRGDITRILNLFVQFGAQENILYESHPHIGTNKLPRIITAISQEIRDCGGKIFFEKKLTGFEIEKDRIRSVQTSDGDHFSADAVILATGHSARDIYTLLYRQGISIEPKPFALGVRVEHPQELIDSIQYHCTVREEGLPPSSYSLVEQVDGKGVFSFCMCPGGIIAPAATCNGELVVNGWSPSKRNNPFANSGMVVQVDSAEAIGYLKTLRGKKDPSFVEETSYPFPLHLMRFQEYVEQNAFRAGGGRFVAPAQRLVDFCEQKISSTLPDCSYLPGIAPAAMEAVLPGFIYTSLQKGLKAFGKKMKGYYTNDAVLLATESRTSSPVRIPRDPQNFHHPRISNLFPCGEGAGYAGGIISAAMDGEKIALAISVALGI